MQEQTQGQTEDKVSRRRAFRMGGVVLGGAAAATAAAVVKAVPVEASTIAPKQTDGERREIRWQARMVVNDETLAKKDIRVEDETARVEWSAGGQAATESRDQWPSLKKLVNEKGFVVGYRISFKADSFLGTDTLVISILDHATVSDSVHGPDEIQNTLYDAFYAHERRKTPQPPSSECQFYVLDVKEINKKWQEEAWREALKDAANVFPTEWQRLPDTENIRAAFFLSEGFKKDPGGDLRPLYYSSKYVRWYTAEFPDRRRYYGRFAPSLTPTPPTPAPGQPKVSVE